MPKINRVRIVNFSYNNNNRHILDAMFDFFGGENALLSLANGGGKSVLVQVMLQPILPKASLLGRKLKDFFTGRNTPSYIMIEWKLDEGAGYLLTGIGIMPSVTHSTNEEEQAADVRYFTFCHEYEEGNSFDIKNIPVTEQIGNTVRIASYTEFRKLLQGEAAKHPMQMDVFDSTREDQQAYEKKLASFGISREEWKELIVQINEAEHGVSEVFTKCKTSKMVMEQWIIKYIEKVLNKSSTDTSDHNKLETMMAQVAWALVENEQHLREYNRIQEFMNDIKGMDDQVRDVLSSLDEEIQLRKSIRNGYHVLKMEEGNLTVEQIRLQDEKRNLNNELHHIDLEEKSLEIYRYEERIEAITEQLNQLKDEIADKAEALKKIDFDLRVQQAAERNQVIQEKRQKIAGLQESLLNALKDQEQLKKDLNRVQYSLKLAYEAILREKAAKIKSLEEEQNRYKHEIEGLNANCNRMRKELNGLNQSLGGVGREIQAFEKKEQSILALLGLQLYRNPLLKELDENDVENAAAGLDKAIADIMDDIDNCNKETEDCRYHISILNENKEKVKNRQIEVNKDWAKVNERIKRFEEDREKMIAILKVYNISEDDLFDKSMILRRIQDKIDDWSNRTFYLKMDISNIDQMLKGIENGVSYLPPRLVALLKEHNISCYTGERFLRELDVNKKKELLKNNPLLPYALIMTENEYIAISELLQEEELSQIVPVVRYNDREMVYENSLGKIQFLSSPKMMQLDPDDIDAYIQQLYEKKNDMLRELEQAEEVIHNANQEYQAVSQFQWERPEIDKLYQESRRLQDLIQELENESRDIQQQVKEKENRLEQLQIIIVDLKGKHAEAVQRKNRFNEYIQENEKYMENLREERKINDQISKVNKDIADAEKAIKSLNECLNKAESSLREEIQAKREIEGKYSAVKGASEDEPIEGSLDELEGKLQAYLSQQNNAAADIEKQIKELEKEIRREEGQIGKLGLNKEDYEGVVYSELLEKELEEKKNALEKGKQSLEKQCHKWEMEKAELEGIKKKLKEDLNGASLIPPKEILGSFDERRKKLQEQLQAKADREREIDKVNRRIAALLAKVESKIKDIMQIEAGAPFKPFHQVVNEIEPMLDQMDRIVDTTNERIDSFKSRTTELKSRYDKNDISVISEALQSILRQVNGLDRSYDKYYYLSERLDSVFINLNAVLKIMEEKVRQLEHDRNDLVEHAFLEAMRIYHEIPKISENSEVEIDGVRRRILDIEYEKIQDELVAKEKMKAYIYDCLDTLKRQIKEKVEEDKVKRDLVKFISTKELLNVISSLENCNVRAYKLDINENNRKMMRWEDIIVKNSGGEKFVAYFSLLVALMSYSRGRSKELFRKAEDTKVLIMDNPFGPITSGHLLKPMFDIAKKYNTQLICLSDIKQESVINCFNLVYMIKIRQNMMRDEYLEFEPHLLTELRADEKLEKAYLHAEQIGLF